MKSQKTVAEKLSKAIDESGLKQKFIADKIGISEQAISAMLNGRQKIEVETFFAIAVVLHLSPDQIYEFRRESA